jgi:hypothetical protein
MSAAWADVAIKIVAANPSKTQTKKAKLQAFLPEEIGPDKVISAGDMKILYDDAKKQYYVFTEIDLEPGATAEREVIIKDIWHIETNVLEQKRADMEKILLMLKNSEFEDKATYLRQSVNEKLAKIAQAQKQQADNPQQHIKKFRDNAALLAQVDGDLAVARTLMLNAKKMPAMKIWIMIISVVGFLGAMSALMYLFWQRQISSGGDLFGDAAPQGKNRFYQDLVSDESKKES